MAEEQNTKDYEFATKVADELDDILGRLGGLGQQVSARHGFESVSHGIKEAWIELEGCRLGLRLIETVAKKLDA